MNITNLPKDWNSGVYIKSPAKHESLNETRFVAQYKKKTYVEDAGK